jgi:hypothetical protein
MIEIRVDLLTVTIRTVIMELVIPIRLWRHREQRQNLIKLAKGE